MGNYSYICKCGRPIREGEKVHLIHVRHGKVLGHAEGEFDGYGSVIENEGFNNASFDKLDGIDKADPNCHDEVMKSCFDFDDSEHKVYARRKVYQGKPVDIYEYCHARSIDTAGPGSSLAEFNKACQDYEQLEDAPKVTPQSGVAAYHKACYDKANEDGTMDLTPSESDPEQGWGTPNPKYL